jgi:hypothetical protein
VLQDGEVLFDDHFTPRDYLIGAGPTADVIVADLEDDEAAVLRLEVIGLGGLATVIPMVPGLEARGQEQEPHRPVIFPDRGAFRIGSFEFRVAHDGPAPALASPNSLPILLFAGAVLAAVAGLIAGQSGGAAQGGGQAGSRAQAPSVTAEPRPAGGPQAAPDARAAADAKPLSEVEADMRLRLIAANLVPPLRVATERGALVISGVVGAEERARTLDTLTANRARIPVPVELRLSSDPDVTSLVAAVAFHPTTYVLGRDGRRYAVGQRLPDGGVIAAVEETSLLIDRDGIKERVIFAR